MGCRATGVFNEEVLGRPDGGVRAAELRAALVVKSFAWFPAIGFAKGGELLGLLFFTFVSHPDDECNDSNNYNRGPDVDQVKHVYLER